LSRSKRDAIWPVFEEYRGQLTSRKLKEVDDAYREIASLLDAGGIKLSYSAIVVDETQDFGPQALKLLRAMVAHESNDLFFVGDGHQRIYSRNRAAMSKCGIDIRGRSRKLFLNYRTTDEIRRTAVALLEGCEVDDLDDGHDEARRYKSLAHGPMPAMMDASGMEEAIAIAIATTKKWQKENEGGSSNTICVIASGTKDRDTFAQQFATAGLATSVVDANINISAERDCIHFATMHRAKGLEFDRVIVVAPVAYFGDPMATDQKRKLLYVALTRAKKEAILVKMQ
jgi:superfamily I DNA/RNA helicase